MILLIYVGYDNYGFFSLLTYMMTSYAIILTFKVVAVLCFLVLNKVGLDKSEGFQSGCTSLISIVIVLCYLIGIMILFVVLMLLIR